MSIAEKIDRIFEISKRGSSIRREVIAGLTTFMTMAYILLVNPAILGKAGVPAEGVVTATALSAALATIMMGLYANAPYALAPGMGLNAYFAYSVVPFIAAIFASRGLDPIDPWKIALAAVLVEGIIFIILSVTKAREAVANSIPTSLKYSIAAGIGLFLTLIGFEDAGLITGNPATFLSFNTSAFTEKGPLIALTFVLVAGVLMALRIPGALLISIILAALTSWTLGVANPPHGVISKPDFSAAFQLDLHGLWSLGFYTALAIVFTFFMVDFFDTLGTVTGLSAIAGLLDERGRVKGIGRMLLTDATGTTIGALLGTSTVTTYIESAAGVEEGGRTGLTAVVVGLLFLTGLLFAPIFTATPSVATAPALIIVGLLMAQAITRIDFKDPTEAIPAFLTIAGIPFTFSIADGMALGFISYTVLKAASGKWKDLNPIVVIIAIIFIAYFISIPHIQAKALAG